MSAAINAERLREMLAYDPATGSLTWRRRSGPRCCVGGVAGSIGNRGYWHVQLDGKKYSAHRLAWLHVHGQWPVNQIDHQNGDRLDNRIANLRDISHSVNAQNLHKANHRSKSGLLGAHWHVTTGKWLSNIRSGGKQKYIGIFDTAEAAHAAYIDAKRELHEGCTL